MSGEEEFMLKRIVAAFDGSQQSYKVFHFALDMSRLCPGGSVSKRVPTYSPCTVIIVK